MITSIGIRVTPKIVYYSVISCENEELEMKILDKVVVPKALDTPEQLKFLRNTFLDIIAEFQITNACVRITEPSAKSISIPRIYIEAVIQELFASSTIIKYYVGQISNISAKLEIKREEFKPYSEGKNIFMEIEDWDKLSLEERESLMSAVSAIKL